jgi:MOSC domain-containing protein YiiM
MAEVEKICFTEKFGNKMISVSSVEVKSNKGIVKDRYFKANNDKDLQITLIELENIDYFNKKSNTNIPYIDFRRNIITKEIELNKLVGKEILIGNVKIKGHRLCDPCKYLQDKLKKNNSFKNLSSLYNRGGLRCEILLNGIISIKDEIKII